MKTLKKKSQILAEERIELAQKAVKAENEKREKEGRDEVVLVNSYYENQAKAGLVRLRVPDENAPYLKYVGKNEIFVFADNQLEKLVNLEIPAHYRHGDHPERRSDGSLRPTIVRNFYIEKGFLGKEMVAIVNINKKIDIATKEEMIIIDIFPENKTQDLKEALLSLKLGAPLKGFPQEVLIPGKKDLCVRLEEIIKK